MNQEHKNENEVQQRQGAMETIKKIEITTTIENICMKLFLI